MPNSQTKLKTVTTLAIDLYSKTVPKVGISPNDIRDAFTIDRQHIERVLVEKLEGKKVANEHNSECLHNDAPEYCDCDNYIKWNQALDQAITLVKEVLQGK